MSRKFVGLMAFLIVAPLLVIGAPIDARRITHHRREISDHRTLLQLIQTSPTLSVLSKHTAGAFTDASSSQPGVPTTVPARVSTTGLTRSTSASRAPTNAYTSLKPVKTASLPPGPLNRAILNATAYSDAHVERILQVTAYHAGGKGTASELTQVVDAELASLVPIMDWLGGQVGAIDFATYRIGIVVQPVDDALVKLFKSWIQVTHAIDETDYATASAAYGLEDWTSATRDVARLLRKAVPNGNEHPFFLQAVKDLGLQPNTVQDLWSFPAHRHHKAAAHA